MRLPPVIIYCPHSEEIMHNALDAIMLPPLFKMICWLDISYELHILWFFSVININIIWFLSARIVYLVYLALPVCNSFIVRFFLQKLLEFWIDGFLEMLASVCSTSVAAPDIWLFAVSGPYAEIWHNTESTHKEGFEN